MDGSSLNDAVETAPRTPGPDIGDRPRVLIADDQPDILQALRLLLKGEDYVIETAPSASAAATRAGEEAVSMT